MVALEVYDTRSESSSNILIDTFYLNYELSMPKELLWYFKTNKDTSCKYYDRWDFKCRPLTSTEQVLYSNGNL